MPPRWLVATAVVMVLGVQGAAGPQAPPFRSGTRLVPVHATVTDRDGRLVPDLTRDDFAIYDNGERQEITVFANEQQPVRVVVMLDRSMSVLDDFDRVRDAAETFVRRLLPEDRARIGSFAVRVQVDPPDFTGDQDELARILHTELQDPGPTPLWNAVAVAINALDDQDARRVVLVFTDGADAPGTVRTSNVTEREATSRARRADVMVYAIGLTGEVSYRGAPRAPMGGGRAGGDFGGLGGFGRMPRAAIVQPPDEGLPRIAAETGGGYFELDAAEDLAATFARVADELHHQYALGFTPGTLDGKTHTIEVRLVRGGLVARARKSYVAAP